MQLVDTHCHLTAARFDDDRDAVVARMRPAGIRRAICIGTGVADARACVDLCAAEPDLLRMAAGIDPFTAQAAGNGFDDELAALAPLLAAPGVVALGEVGLDYHYQDLPAAAVQRRQLVAQLALAAERDLPVVIHARDCHADMAAVLAEHPDLRGVIHSFSGDTTEAAGYLALEGWYLSFNGIVTFKNARTVQAAARTVPADRLLLETDSPYLAPVPRRGQRCEPALIEHTCRFLAALRGVAPEELAAQTTRNAEALFGLGLDPA